MNKNQAEGRAEEAKGKSKEVVGKVIGDKRTEFEGKAEKFGGKAKAKVGDMNDTAKKSTKPDDKGKK